MTDKLHRLAKEARQIERTLDYWNPDEDDEYFSELVWREKEILEEMARLIFEAQNKTVAR